MTNKRTVEELMQLATPIQVAKAVNEDQETLIFDIKEVKFEKGEIYEMVMNANLSQAVKFEGEDTVFPAFSLYKGQMIEKFSAEQLVEVPFTNYIDLDELLRLPEFAAVKFTTVQQVASLIKSQEDIFDRTMLVSRHEVKRSVMMDGLTYNVLGHGNEILPLLVTIDSQPRALAMLVKDDTSSNKLYKLNGSVGLPVDILLSIMKLNVEHTVENGKKPKGRKGKNQLAIAYKQ